jgi:hypothetical protein
MKHIETKEMQAAAKHAGTETFLQAQQRKESALADLRELELRKVRRDLVPVEDVLMVYGKILANVRARLLGLGNKLGARVVISGGPNQATALINREIIQALKELLDDEAGSDTIFRQLTESGVSKPSRAEATAPVICKRVGRPRTRA